MAKYEKININKLELDLFNPRLPKSMRIKATEQEIIEFMLMEASTLELMMAIGENDFFEGEQLLVVEKKDKKGFYTVIEGNRRLTAVKLLNNPALSSVKKNKIEKIISEATYFPIEIPCLKFKDLEKIKKHLGFRHVTGVKSWRLLEKARYLNDLKKNHFQNKTTDETYRAIAKMIGSWSDYVKRLLIGFELYEKVEDENFYKIYDLNDTNFHLNYLTDSLNKENIKLFIGLDTFSENHFENFKTLISWFFKPNAQGFKRVKGDSKGLKYLNAILGQPRALAAFREKGLSLDQAYELTGEIDELFRTKITNSFQSLNEADGLVHKVKEEYRDLNEDLLSIRRLTVKIRGFFENKADGEF